MICKLNGFIADAIDNDNLLYQFRVYAQTIPGVGWDDISGKTVQSFHNAYMVEMAKGTKPPTWVNKPTSTMVGTPDGSTAVLINRLGKETGLGLMLANCFVSALSLLYQKGAMPVEKVDPEKAAEAKEIIAEKYPKEKEWYHKAADITAGFAGKTTGILLAGSLLAGLIYMNKK